MDYSDRKKLINNLEKEAKNLEGPEYDSIMYKTAKLKEGCPANCYSMSSELSTSAIDIQICLERRFVEGLKKILIEQKNNENLKDKIRIAEKRLYHLGQERSKCSNEIKKHDKFERISGRVILTVKKIECDPLFNVKHIDFFVNRIRLQSLTVENIHNPVRLEFQRGANIELMLTSSNRDSIYGLILLPTSFYEEHSNEEIILRSHMFNFITLHVEFERCQIINHSNKKFECIVTNGHGFNRVKTLANTHCNVCLKKCQLKEDSYVCIKCRVHCHINCAKYILFKCLGNEIYFGCSNICGEEDIAMAGNRTESQLSSFTPNLESIKIREEKYDIAHNFNKKFSWGFHSCLHCGERINLASKMYYCKECSSYFHEKCKRFAFNSCGIEYELRTKMVEFQREKFEKTRENSDNGKYKTITDFSILDVVGKGSFGKVVLVSENKSKKKYALKVIKKQSIYSSRDLRNVETEESILRTVTKGDCPFFVAMHFYFQDKYRIYIGLDYVKGGVLRHWLSKGAFTESRTKFYTIELIKALEFLHRHNIAYRDMKLDNILLSGDGHIKLCDFGLSKLEMGPDTVTYTYCGSLDTVAPEVLAGEGYKRSVDFWSLGVVVFEMMHRRSPFTGSSIEELATAIKHTKLRVEVDISKEAMDFVFRMLLKEPESRLGYGAEGCFSIKSHPWFRDVDWDSVDKPAGIPEFVPPYHQSNLDDDVKGVMLNFTPAVSVIDIHKYIEQYEELECVED
ncbi:hypothetical protein PAEPH01_1368 [Pancytospora epiphaga]|nr:hypothetical protein PAEPH01_1368 [Pancytospora epiphaga]